MKKRVVLGLTGGIATGKSTVLKIFRKLGARVVDSDILARKAVRPGKPAFRKILQCFGREVLKRDGTLDRKKLGAIVFKDSEKRRLLEGMIHPEVVRDIKKEISRFKQGLFVADVPLLFEAGLERLFDKTALVWASKDIQMKRLMKRNRLARKEALQRVSAQWPLSRKKGFPDYLLDNSREIERTRRQIRDFYLRFFD